MHCYCHSKNLQSKSEQQREFSYLDHNNKQSTFKNTRQPSTSQDVRKSTNLELFNNLLDIAQIVIPKEIPIVDQYEIESDPIWFQREQISVNKPCKIQNALGGWQALDKWQDNQYLNELFDANNCSKFTVDITPDGFADSIHGPQFAQPYQQEMNFADFLKIQEKYSTTYPVVPYIQKQNNNLTEEMPFLMSDVDTNVPEFFSTAFFDNQRPDATNFWMGLSGSVSAMHKDPQENIQAVVRGEKHFTLMPPHVQPYLQPGKQINSRWSMQDNEIVLKPQYEEEQLEWVGVNVDSQSDRSEQNQLEQLPQLHVVVEAGEILQLPALWQHQVTQHAKSASDYVIAVNFWYDMRFDHKQQIMEMLRGLIQKEKWEGK